MVNSIVNTTVTSIVDPPTPILLISLQVGRICIFKFNLFTLSVRLVYS